MGERIAGTRDEYIHTVIHPAWNAMAFADRVQRLDELGHALGDAINEALRTHSDADWDVFMEMMRAYVGLPSSVSLDVARSYLVYVCGLERRARDLRALRSARRLRENLGITPK